MIRTYGAASSGITSGVGLAIAKTIASSFILPSDSAWMIPGPERPTKRSHALDHVVGPAEELLGVRVLGVPALDRRSSRPTRSRRGSVERAPLRSQPMMWVTPAASIILVTATPAAPRPTIRTRSSSIGLSTIFSALKSAAMVTTAVPCWSSWKTGMSSVSLSRSSISKQRGAEMSSRLMPPKVGAISFDRLDDLLGVLGVEADREGVDAGELLEQHRLALHHRHRRLGADVAEAEHGAAVGDDGDRVLLDRVLEGLGAVLVDVRADPGDARACRPSRGRRGSSAGTCSRPIDLAAAVHLHRAVDVVEHPGAAGRADRRAGSAPSAPGRWASIVNSRTRLPSPPAPGTRSTPCSWPPASAIAAVSLPSGSWRASSSTRTVTLYWALTGHGQLSNQIRAACLGSPDEAGALRAPEHSARSD